MADLIRITDTVHIPRTELEISYIRSSGPGGQNVNKVATAAQLRFDVAQSPSLSAATKVRASRIAGSRITTDGVIVITASEFRSQQQNHDEAVRRLVELLRRASIAPKKRIATRPTLGSKGRRLAAKTIRAEVKRGRSNKPVPD